MLSAEVDGVSVTTANVQRRWASPGVEVTPVRELGLVGEFYRPPSGADPVPAVLVVGGSEGGLGRGGAYKAAGLASHGLAALALAYFGAEGLPRHLSLIGVGVLPDGIELAGGATGHMRRAACGSRCVARGRAGAPLGGDIPEHSGGGRLCAEPRGVVRAEVRLAPAAVGVDPRWPPPCRSSIRNCR